MKINMNTSHPSAFISSTFIDLHEERQCVADALHESGLNVNALDIKPASTDSSKKEIIEGIHESDFVILLIGDRYGSILPQMTGNQTQSITWWEYTRARAFGKPVIAYFKKVNSYENDGHDDKSESSYAKKRKSFERFKTMVMNQHNPAYFTDPSEIYEKIQRAIIPTYRSGVKQLNIRNSKLSTKITELEAELVGLKTISSAKNLGLSAAATNPAVGGLAGLRGMRGLLDE